MPADGIIEADFREYCGMVYPDGMETDQALQIQMVWYGAFSAALSKFARISNLPPDQQLETVRRMQAELQVHCMALAVRDIPGGRA